MKGFVKQEVIKCEYTGFIDYQVVLKCEKGTLKLHSYIDTEDGTKEEQEVEISSVEYWNNQMKSLDTENKYGKVKKVNITWI